jgi:hypothetical protein
MAWKRGPLPPGTYNWGGVVPAGEDTGYGFYFADFCGDHVECYLGDADPRHRFKAHEIAWYDNGLELPPPEAKVYGRAGPGAGGSNVVNG